MKQENTVETVEMIELVRNFTKGIDSYIFEEDARYIKMQQRDDLKNIFIDKSMVYKVLQRTDHMGKDFLQINFIDDSKILVTDSLIGFKPTPVSDLDMTKIPKVVTTPDIVSVFEAIEECLRDEDLDYEEISTLKRVFSAIVMGAESVGFDMEEEHHWLKRLVLGAKAAS
ncbi:MAG: hypothetical protein AB8E15_09155 [Bdellovibrionales bacterium]